MPDISEGDVFDIVKVGQGVFLGLQVFCDEGVYFLGVGAVFKTEGAYALAGVGADIEDHEVVVFVDYAAQLSEGFVGGYALGEAVGDIELAVSARLDPDAEFTHSVAILLGQGAVLAAGEGDHAPRAGVVRAGYGDIGEFCIVFDIGHPVLVKHCHTT